MGILFILQIKVIWERTTFGPVPVRKSRQDLGSLTSKKITNLLSKLL